MGSLLGVCPRHSHTEFLCRSTKQANSAILSARGEGRECEELDTSSRLEATAFVILAPSSGGDWIGTSC